VDNFLQFVKSFFNAVFGKDIYTELINMIDKSSVAKFKARQLEYEKTINKIVNNFLKTAVAVKPQIAIKQMSAFINYSEGIPKSD
jgi:hypothetical protein